MKKDLNSRLRNVNGTLGSVMHYPKSEVPAHVHDVPLLTFVLEGHTTEIDDRRRKELVGPMTMIYQPPGWTHAHVAETEVTMLCLALSSDFVHRFSDIASELERPMILTNAAVVGASLRLHNEMWADDKASNLVLEGLMIELLGECVRQNQPRLGSTPPRWLRQARELVRDQFSDPLSLDHIAIEVGVHPNHLSRMYRACYRETIGESIRRLRLEHGVRQVAATDLTIGEIAAQAGFYDNAHFTRECRKVLGISPQEIRRSVQGL